MGTGWRIVPADHAARAFDGEGARLYGGRWNSPGVPMVYSSQHLSLAALELRVHIDKTRMRKLHKCFAFHFEDSLASVFEARRLPPEWRQEPPPPSLQRLGGELNYLINPRHPDFGRIKFETPTDFAFDHRLF